MVYEFSMTPVIADILYTRTRPDGVQKSIRVEIGLPEPLPAEAGLGSGYYATSRITGITEDGEGKPSVHFDAHIARDSAIALGYAVSGPAEILKILPFASEIDGSALPNFGLPIFPKPRAIRAGHRRELETP